MVILATMLLMVEGPVAAQNNSIDGLKIGVLAKRGDIICLERWQSTADYLTENIPGYYFEIIPLGFDELLPAVRNGEIDFMLANSAYYVMAEKQYFVHRLATLNNLRLGTETTRFAGVLFTRADQLTIQHITDLKGKTFAAVAPLSLGGWLAGRLELVRRGLNPEKDLVDLQFLGTHDAVINAVLSGEVEAGTVRSDALERMELEGKINLSQFRILDQHHSQHCRIPFVHSTEHYPEWPIAQLNHLDEKLASIVSAALLNMPEKSPAALDSHSAGWRTPISYQPVRVNLQLQRIGPWSDYGQVDFSKLVRDHLAVVITVSILAILLVMLTIRLNHSRIRLRDLAAKQLQTLELHQQAKLDLQESNRRLENTLEQLHQEEARLVQTEKLATVGQVAAGVAHEINNPIGFIMSNLCTLREYFEFMSKFTTAHQRRHEAVISNDGDAIEKWSSRIEKLRVEDDPDFIREDSVSLIRESVDGAMRIKKIVLNLKEMAQIGAKDCCPLDLNQGIIAIHGVAKTNPEFKGKILLDLEDIPEFDGHPGELNQAILNLLINAIQFSPERENITVSSRHENDTIVIRITDKGPGISAEDQDKIFNPFFTTQPTGKGPGLGLSLSRNIINRHGGSLTVDSSPGHGASFVISLPVVPQTENAPAPV